MLGHPFRCSRVAATGSLSGPEGRLRMGHLATEPGADGEPRATEPRWESMLRGEHAFARVHRLGRRAFALLPSPWRCKFCNAPFRGPSSGLVRWLGYAP